MIITCNNCNKKFDIDSSLIPDKGRLLQCASCDHKWFFKKEVLENKINPIVEDIDNINIFEQNNSLINEEKSLSNVPINNTEIELEEEIKKEIEINTNESKTLKTKPKKQKNFKILNIFVVIIITFVAFIIM